MAKELEKNYNPADIEQRLYEKWEQNKYFHAEVDRSRKPFTIVMPPPNITGQLHMGHALDNTIQDILIRTKRMQGYEALWVPGTDHASIATEAKIVEKMREEGITKEDLGQRCQRNFWKEPGNGKSNTAEGSLRSLRKSALPATGTENGLPWMRAVTKL